ncbi:MAG: hypothetical protein JXQ73_12090 [Phycisphaerae bacterium]|nr:hypothetical protein [Phycisphaerae bacterium]
MTSWWDYAPLLLIPATLAVIVLERRHHRPRVSGLLRQPRPGVSDTERADGAFRRLHSVDGYVRHRYIMRGCLIAFFTAALIVLAKRVIPGITFSTEAGAFVMSSALLAGIAGRHLVRYRREKFFRRVRALDHLTCPDCHHRLDTHREGGACPECGYAFTPESLRQDWEDVEELSQIPEI